MATFLKLSPCRLLHMFKESLLAVSGTKDGFIGIIVCPTWLAISYPSPVEPVTG